MEQACKPSFHIVEQPATHYRFRYETERASLTKLTGRGGRNSWPSIKISGGPGDFLIIISCVTAQKLYRPHPFSVVDRSKVKDVDFVNEGVYAQRIVLSEGHKVVDFRNIGIIRNRKEQLNDILKQRMRLNVDPFKTGFKDFISEFQSKKPEAVRLCFQVFKTSGELALKPVVSDVISAKKNLIIDHVSHDSGPSYASTCITIICNKVHKNDIEVIFFDDVKKWEKAAQVIHVYRDTAIVCYTPIYQDPPGSGQVLIKLRRKSDNICSNVVNFVYTNSKTSSKTLSESLLSRQIEENIPAPAVCTNYQHLGFHPSPDLLKQDQQTFTNQVKSQEQKHQNSNQWPKFFEQSNVNIPILPILDKYSSSGMVNLPVPVQAGCSTWQPKAPLPPSSASLKMNEDNRVNTQTQIPRRREKLPKSPKVSNVNGMTSSVIGKSSTSEMVFPLPVNANTGAPGLGTVNFNLQAAPIGRDKNPAKTTSRTLEANENFNYINIRDDDNPVPTRTWHIPTPAEDLLPSFGYINHTLKSSRPNESLAVTEEPDQLGMQQSIADTMLPMDDNPGFTRTWHIPTPVKVLLPSFDNIKHIRESSRPNESSAGSEQQNILGRQQSLADTPLPMQIDSDIVDILDALESAYPQSQRDPVQ